MTGFDKTGFPHTSNSSTLTACNLTTQYAIDLQFSLHYTIAGQNLKVIAYSHIDLQSPKPGRVWKPGFVKSSHKCCILGVHYILQAYPQTIPSNRRVVNVVLLNDRTFPATVEASVIIVLVESV